MRGVARKNEDTAGGRQLAGHQDWVTVDGHLVVCLGDPVEGHGSGAHGGPVMAEAESWITIDGVPVCFEGHRASCGHPTTGSDWVGVL